MEEMLFGRRTHLSLDQYFSIAYDVAMSELSPSLSFYLCKVEVQLCQPTSIPLSIV